jgi:methionine synthase I (cobalamin-dependent)
MGDWLLLQFLLFLCCGVLMGVGDRSGARRVARGAGDEIIRQATMGASLAEMAAYHEVSEEWLLKNFGREIAKAWARRNIFVRSALTKAALGGNVAALKRVTELERRANEV